MAGRSVTSSRNAEWWTALTLRFGVSISAVLVAVGLLLVLLLPEVSLFGFLSPKDFINLGLLVLIGTSILRVLATSLAFLLERDHAHAAIGAAVFMILITSLVLGKVE